MTRTQPTGLAALTQGYTAVAISQGVAQQEMCQPYWAHGAAETGTCPLAVEALIKGVQRHVTLMLPVSLLTWIVFWLQHPVNISNQCLKRENQILERNESD